MPFNSEDDVHQPDRAFFDLSHWPVAFIRFPELDEPDRVTRLLGGLGYLLARKEPFVAVWIPASHDHDDEPHADEKASTIWIKKNRQALNTFCKGYLYVTQDEQLRELLIGRLKTVSGKLYQFPMQVVETQKRALQVSVAMLE